MVAMAAVVREVAATGVAGKAVVDEGTEEVGMEVAATAAAEMGVSATAAAEPAVMETAAAEPAVMETEASVMAALGWEGMATYTGAEHLAAAAMAAMGWEAAAVAGSGSAAVARQAASFLQKVHT